MQPKNNNNLNKLYIFFFSIVLFINIISTTKLNANLFKITELEISEPFDLNFNKSKVIDKGFKEAFIELLFKITTSGDTQKVQNTSLPIIKSLIDSFTMSNESFINKEYYAKFDVNFNKENILNFFEKKNIFPSIPKKKSLLFIPVIVDVQTDEISLFTNNIFYDAWNQKNERYFLLDYFLPNEDLEDINFILNNSKAIENYDFSKTILKYDINHFIISIIYKDKNNLTVLSKIKLDNSLKIDNHKFNKIDLSKTEDFDFVTKSLKIIYENHWKKINQINTSIKLPLTVSIKSSDHKNIKKLESVLEELDLVSKFEIANIDNKNILYKVIYNGSPNRFIDDMKSQNLSVENKNQIWIVK